MEIQKCLECDNPARTKGLCPTHAARAAYGHEEQKTYTDRVPGECAVSHCARTADGYKPGSLCEAHYQLKYRGVDPETRILRDNDPTRTDRKCWVPDCARRVSTKGLCKYHYTRAKSGRLEVPESLGVPINPACSYEGCDRVSETKGLCHAHYEQLRNGGTLTEIRDWGKYTKGLHVCSIPSCRKPSISKGLCNNHGSLRATYQISTERMIEVWTDPKCENPGCESTENLHMDHDHLTGEFRGLLCSSCNVAFGFLTENISRINGLVEYAKRFESTEPA